jgi:hypothetical protein
LDVLAWPDPTDGDRWTWTLKRISGFGRFFSCNRRHRHAFQHGECRSVQRLDDACASPLSPLFYPLTFFYWKITHNGIINLQDYLVTKQSPAASKGGFRTREGTVLLQRHELNFL